MTTPFKYELIMNPNSFDISETVRVKRPKNDRERIMLALQGYLPSPFGPIWKNGQNVTIWFKYGQKPA
jgi:hypothetical protein